MEPAHRSRAAVRRSRSRPGDAAPEFEIEQPRKPSPSPEGRPSRWPSRVPRRAQPSRARRGRARACRAPCTSTTRCRSRCCSAVARCRSSAARSHDEQVIVMDPRQAARRRRAAAGVRTRRPRGATRDRPTQPDAAPGRVRREVKRGVLAARRAGGRGRGPGGRPTGQPQPLATLRLTATVLPRSAEPADRAGAEAAAAATGLRAHDDRRGRGVTPFVDPQTLTIDENLVGAPRSSPSTSSCPASGAASPTSSTTRRRS